jgi:beta-glucosidase
MTIWCLPLGSPVSVVNVSFGITNTGKWAGSEVSQLYVAFPAAANEPVKQLKAFAKVDVQPGEEAQVQMSLTLRDLSVWDASAHNWSILKGTYGLLVGPSSADIKFTFTFEI